MRNSDGGETRSKFDENRRRLKRRLRSRLDPVRRAILSRFAQRRFFIDCGGMKGQSVRKFKLEFDPKERYIVHTFEPNPRFESCYDGLSNHVLHRAGVWVSDGEMSFYLDRGDGEGSSLLESKRTGDLDFADPERIRTVDLSGWLAENFTKSDYVILKLDIEGAEFEVLEKMLEDGTMKLIDELFIEWHWEKVQVPKERMTNSKKRIRVPIRTWNALNY